MQDQQPTNIVIADPCEKSKVNPYVFTELQVEIQFDEQKPIRLQSCNIHVSNQQSIVISYQTSSTQLNGTNQKTIKMEIPFGSILCLGKKSSTTTLLMVKDKDKQIERDQNGYELVSDDQENQEFQEKTNQLYLMISSSIKDSEFGSGTHNKPADNSQTINITIDQKCNILLTVNPQPQSCISAENLQGQSSSFVYKYLSDEMQKFQNNLNQSSNGQWTNNLKNLQQMQFEQGYEEQDLIGDDQDDEDYDGEEQNEDQDDHMDQEVNQ